MLTGMRTMNVAIDLMHKRYIIKLYNQLHALTLFIVFVNRHLKIKIKYDLLKYGLCIRSNAKGTNQNKMIAGMADHARELPGVKKGAYDMRV